MQRYVKKFKQAFAICVSKNSFGIMKRKSFIETNLPYNGEYWKLLKHLDGY